jgi:hypothetical protein
MVLFLNFQVVKTNTMKMQTKTLNWKTWMIHGDQYFKGSKPKDGKISILGPVIRYNLMSMALESYAMAILDYHDTLPDNHTFTDLLTALDSVVEIDPELKSRILEHESIQSICSMDKFVRREPTEEELDKLYKAIKEIYEMAHGICV